MQSANRTTNPNSRSRHPSRLPPIRPERPDRPRTRTNSSTGRRPAPLIPTRIPSSAEPPSARFRASNSLGASHPGRCRSGIRWTATPSRTNFGSPTRMPVGASGITRCSPSPDRTRLACTKPPPSSGGRFGASPRASSRGPRRSSCRVKPWRTCEGGGNRPCRYPRF